MAGTLAAMAVVAMMAGPFAKPNTAAPVIGKSAAEAEAQKQSDYILDSQLAETERVNAIAERLLQANVDLCPQTRLQLGLVTSTAAEFKKPLKEAAVRRWGLADRVKVISLRPQGAAARAGVQVGDEIVSIDGAAVETGKNAQILWSRQVSKVVEKAPAEVRLGVRRGEETLELALEPVSVCGYEVVLDTEAPELNAYADGKRIIITRAMYRLAASDSELALVIGHELAHNAKRHINAQKQNQGVGMAGGLLLDIAAAAAGVNTEGAFMKAGAQIGAGMYSPEFEAEADYVGLYFMARAGFDTEGVETFWRKMAAENPKAAFNKGSHPPTPDRFLAIAAAREEIAGKMRDSAGPLTPNTGAAR